MEHIQTKINLEMRRGGFLAVSNDNVTIERGKIFTQTTSFQHSMLDTHSNSHTALTYLNAIFLHRGFPLN